MIKRLIFDVDGTLITKVNFIGAIEKTLKKIGIYSGNTVRLFLEAIKTYENLNDSYNFSAYTEHMRNIVDRRLPDDFVTIFFEELKSAIPNRNELLINTIDRLSQKYELVLLTNYFAESQLNRLNNMGIGKYFKECYGEQCIKPNKQAYLSACGDKQASECIMIGDDIYLDIQRAQEEGLNTIFVNSKGIGTGLVRGIQVNSVEEISEDIIKKIENSTCKKQCLNR